MKLIFFCNDLPFFLNHFSTLLLKATEIDYDVTVIAGGYTSDSLKKMEKYKAKFIPLQISRTGTNIFSEIKVFLDIFKILKNTNPDTIHLFTIKPCIYGGLISRLLRIPNVVGTVTGLGYTFSGNGIFSKIRASLLLFLYRSAFGFNNKNTKLVFENSDDCDYFTSHNIIKKEKTSKVWGAGVDLQLFVPRVEYATQVSVNSLVKVLLPSRMLRDKGVVEFIEAAKIIKASNLPIEMILVGGVDTANPASFTEAELIEYVQQGFVNWLGFQSDMPSHLKNADIVCLPSYREGMPKVLLEALACGKPVITTEAPGCREVITDQIEGLIIPLRDGKALADAIVKISMCTDTRLRMGKASRERAEQLFSDVDIASKYIDLYKTY